MSPSIIFTIALLIGLAAAATTTFVVNVDSKPGEYMGWNEAYNITSPVEAFQPRLTLVIGETYVFRVENGCNHPFIITRHRIGATDRGIYNRSVENNGACGNTSLTWTVPQTNPEPLYYQCLYHQYMGRVITLINRTETRLINCEAQTKDTLYCANFNTSVDNATFVRRICILVNFFAATRTLRVLRRCNGEPLSTSTAKIQGPQDVVVFTEEEANDVGDGFRIRVTVDFINVGLFNRDGSRITIQQIQMYVNVEHGRESTLLEKFFDTTTIVPKLGATCDIQTYLLR